MTAIGQYSERGFRAVPAWLAGILLLVLAAVPAVLHAHAASESYLKLKAGEAGVSGQLTLNLLDLGPVLGLDIAEDGAIDPAEITNRREDIQAYVRERLRIELAGEPMHLEFGELVYGTQNGEHFVLAQLDVNALRPFDSVDVTYMLFIELGRQHQCLFSIDWGEGRLQESVFTAVHVKEAFEPDSSTGSGFLAFVRSGVWHIWIGYDHILFLISLLIPAVFMRGETRRRAVTSFAPALGRVAMIVSAFTLAHSITLSLSVLGIVQLPSRWVESAIAASVILAAAYNFLPNAAGGRGAWLAFAFGLLHGFGFAGVLSELALPATDVWRPLLGFNLGVEIGQLCIVALFFPFAYVLRETRFYRIGVVYAGSAAVCLCASLWLVQRAF